MLRFDVHRTRHRILQLQQYYQNSVLSGREFVCKYCLECKASISENLNFFEGQLSHVGSKYDLWKTGKELRIVISGIEYGHPPGKVDMGERRKIILNETGMGSRCRADETHERRNTHMKGTTLLLKRILLGLSASQRYDDWSEEFVGDVGREEDHIFNMFALVNFLLCSAVGNDTMGKSTKTMLQNCSAHYVETLKILEPTLVIFQGMWRFEQVLRTVGLLDCWRQEDKHLGHFKGHGLEFTTCQFYHPAARRGDWAWGEPTRPYFQNTVLPTLHRALREIGFE